MKNNTLRRRRLGRTELYPTALSLGGAWLGSESDSDDEAALAVRRALELGINFIDTDPGYMSGDGERRAAAGLRGVPRASYLLGTKVGTRPGMEQDFSAGAVRESVRQSLAALGTDYLDLLLIHDPEEMDAVLAPGSALDELVRLREEGVARAIGIGCRSHDDHRRAVESGRIDALITYKDYTLLEQSALDDTIPLATAAGVGVILASPLDMGQLTGEEPDAHEHPRAHAMWAWARRHDVSVRDLAMRFCLRLPIDGCVLFGPATALQVDEGVASALRPIPEDVWLAFAAEFGVAPLGPRDGAA